MMFAVITILIFRYGSIAPALVILLFTHSYLVCLKGSSHIFTTISIHLSSGSNRIDKLSYLVLSFCSCHDETVRIIEPYGGGYQVCQAQSCRVLYSTGVCVV